MSFNRFWHLPARQAPFVAIAPVTDQAVILAGQSNAANVHTYAKAAYEAVLDTYWRNTENVLLNGAMSGSALLYNHAGGGHYWYNDATMTYGNAWDNFAAKVAAYSGVIRAIHWDQGENDQGDIANNPTKQAAYKAGLVTVFTAMRALIGEVPVMISPIGRRGDASTGMGYQVVREIQKQLASEHDWIFLLPEKITEGDDGAAHLDNAGYINYAAKAARKTLAVLGEAITGVDGPSISGVTRSGKQLTVSLTHDAGNDFTPTSAIEGFKFTDNGSNVALSNVARKDTSSITMTLAAKPAGTPILYYGYDRLTGVDETKLVRDNAAITMPLRTARITSIPLDETYMDDVVSGAVHQHDARLNGYAGGQTIPNLIPFPHDGESQSAYDGLLGSSASVAGNDPGFSTDHWTFDGDDYNRVGAPSPSAFHAGLSTNKSFTFICHFKTPPSITGQPQIFSCGGTGASIPGLALRYITPGNFMRIATANGTASAALSMSSASQLSVSTVYKMAFAYNPSTGAYTLWLNGATPVLTGTATLNGATSASPFSVFNQFTSGTELYGYGMYDSVLDNTQIGALFDYFDTL